MLRVVQTGSAAEELVTLDVLARRGAQEMLKAALEIEVEEYLQQHRKARDESGHALVVRNGYARARRV